MTGRRVAGALAAPLLLAAALAAAQPKTPPPDPVREEFARAVAPGLADTTTARLAAFLARFGRHPLARAAHHELGLLAYGRGDYARAREASFEAARKRRRTRRPSSFGTSVA